MAATRTFENPLALRSTRGISSVRVMVDRVPVMNDAPINDACDTPQRAAGLVSAFIAGLGLDYETERFFILHLSVRRRVIGITAGPTGTLNTMLVDPREVFRAAIVSNAAAIVLAHTHPSGDPAPSEADIRVTRELIRAGQLLKIEVLDHVIIANPALPIPGSSLGYSSLRELGYFYL